MQPTQDSPLTVELVPKTAWWDNVRSHVSRADWDKCKAYAKAKTNDHCIICGQQGKNQGRKHNTECHEIWEYDDTENIQTLVDIWPLCPLCHQVKHLGRTRHFATPDSWERVINHFQKVNGWPDWRVERYLELVFMIWDLRSRQQWKLDISLLGRIGLDITEQSA